MVYLHSLESVLTIIVMFMAGFFMSKAGWFSKDTGRVFTKIILNVSLPCYMLWNIRSNFSRASLEKNGGGLVVPFLSIGICYLLGVLVSKLFRVRKGRVGVFRSVFFTSNTIFIGLPVNLELFGPKSTPYVLLYYIANTTFFWTVGAYEISRDGFADAEKKPSFFSNTNSKKKHSSQQSRDNRTEWLLRLCRHVSNWNWYKRTLKKVVSPALMGFSVAIVLVLLNIRLPQFVMNSCLYLGELTTPLAMLFIGMVLSSVNWRSLRLDKDIILLLIARFLICPLTIYGISAFIPLSPLMRQVFVIQSAMPAMTSTGIVAKDYGADCEFATVVIVVTTVLSMLVIPAYMAIGA